MLPRTWWRRHSRMPGGQASRTAGPRTSKQMADKNDGNGNGAN